MRNHTDAKRGKKEASRSQGALSLTLHAGVLSRLSEALQLLHAMTDPEIEEFRAQIADVDRTILEAVNTRLQLVDRLQTYKRSHGLPELDMRQEHKIVRTLTRANQGPLSERGVRELAGELLELTKRELRLGRS
jgi:chorismate mutase